MDFIKTKDLQQVRGYTYVLARHTVTEDERDYLDPQSRAEQSEPTLTALNKDTEDQAGERP